MTLRKSNGFAENVFDDSKMKKHLPPNTYRAIVAARQNFTEPTDKDRDIYANALIRWAMKKGVTRYIHWFQPLNNFTAGKRDSFYSIDGNYRAVVKFRGKELSKGEGDASSFPNGGIRQTFEARGVTQWDYTSYAYIVDDCLYIPTTFGSFNGEVLDKKTPLVRSLAALNKQATRVLNVIGDSARHVYSAVGAEQEYFLIDKELFRKRRDLVYTGRTLYGAKPPKGQEFHDHYFRKPDSKAIKFMQELDSELWKLGIVVKTEHNEVAPKQLELAPCYTKANLACDHNLLTMETLRKVADKNGMTCLLHEKPFNNLSGSGKHNNWSLLTDNGCNLLEIGSTPYENARFMLFLAAVLAAVDDYSELLLASVSSAGNDCRLGGYEAPPQILTVFLGEPLSNAIKNVCSRKWQAGVDRLSQMPSGTDRNRTSPFAFTGNKFEFRMVGSSVSISDVNTALNVAVAESLRQFADVLENSTNLWQDVTQLIAETFIKHRRVIFDGNNYSSDWAVEAERRKLKSANTVAAIEAMSNAHNVNLLERHGVLSHKEVLARQKILLQNYTNTLRVEGQVALEMYRKQIAPAVEKYVATLTQTAKNKSDLDIACDLELNKIDKLCKLLKQGLVKCATLKKHLVKADEIDCPLQKAKYMQSNVLPAMEALRERADTMEQLCPQDVWAIPTYGQILYDENTSTAKPARHDSR